MMDTAVMKNQALKAAKKSLKNQDDNSMKLKVLAKLIVEQLNDNESNHKMVQKWIKDSDKFHVDGKKVTLSKKRKLLTTTDADVSTEEKVSKKKSKKARKKSNNSSSKVSVSSDGSNNNEDQKTSSTMTKASSPSVVEEWRKEHKIVIKQCQDDEKGQKETKKLQQDPTYYPFCTFDECLESSTGLPTSLINQCTNINKFKTPSPIQAQSWPILMKHQRDVVGIAETGSGKTLAFALPALASMYEHDKQNGGSKRRLPRLLVLSPTRELAMQVATVLEEYGTIVGLSTLVLYGGVPKHTQVQQLKQKTIDCLVATPGRIKDLINDGTCHLHEIQHLVLDEADRMLDMGFEEDVKFIISQCKSKDDGRQTAMFSATWPAAIQDIAMNYMINPVRIYVGFEAIVGSNGENNVDDSLSANKRVQQNIEVIDDRMREGRLKSLLRQHQKNKQRILIFALYKKEAERLEYSLKRDGFNVCSIHGNKNQTARTQALSDFKNGTCQMMVATDVAARGLDIPDVELVINFTFPLTIEDYVHRIGRTGRAGKSGISYTFFQPTDKSHAGELQQVMKQAGQEPPEALMKFGSTIKKKEHKLYGNFGPRDGMPMKKATKITFNYSDDES